MILEPKSAKKARIDITKKQVNDDEYYAYINGEGKLVVEISFAPWDGLKYIFD